MLTDEIMRIFIKSFIDPCCGWPKLQLSLVDVQNKARQIWQVLN